MSNFKTLFHLSNRNCDNEIFVPRQMPKWRAMEGENWRIKRICVSDSIDGALASLLSCDSQPFGKHLFVHIPEDLDRIWSKNKVFFPTRKHIPDVEATHEMWIKVPVKMKCVGEIEIIDIDPNVDLSYEDDDGQNIPLDSFIWKWIWKKDV